MLLNESDIDFVPMSSKELTCLDVFYLLFVSITIHQELMVPVFIKDLLDRVHVCFHLFNTAVEVFELLSYFLTKSLVILKRLAFR